MKTSKLVFILFSIVLLAAQVVPVGAQSQTGNTNWGSFFDSNGNKQPGVQDAGLVYQDADWMPTYPDWTGLPQPQAEYHQYVAPDGSTMLVPTNTTWAAMAANPDASGYNGASSIISGMGTQTWSPSDMSLNDVQSWNDLVNLVSNTYNSFVWGDQFADATISTGNAWTLWWTGDSAAMFKQFLAQSWTDGALYQSALLYNNCSASPAGCPASFCASNPVACGLTAAGTPGVTAVPTAVPTMVVVTPPPPASCPVASVSQSQPSMAIGPGEPAYPVVVGQDPEKRGADVTGHITLPPVILTWYEPVYEKVDDCVGPQDPGTFPCVKGIPMQVTKLKECKVHHESLPEQITSTVATATLSAASQNWILNTLSKQWPEAYIHRASFNLLQYGGSSGSCNGGGTCSATVDALKVPFADPGYFDLRMQVQTAGTFWNGSRITQPRSLSVTGRLGVTAILPTLIDGSTSE